MFTIDELPEHKRRALIAKISGLVEGERPPAAPIPPSGIYWLKTTHTTSYSIDENCQKLPAPTNRSWSVWTWEGAKLSEWFLARINDDHGSYDVFGDDCGSDWENHYELVTHVGPCVEAPKEE